MNPADSRRLVQTAERARRLAARAHDAALERDQLICTYRAGGVSLRDLAALAGVSHSAIAKIVERTETR